MKTLCRQGQLGPDKESDAGKDEGAQRHPKRLSRPWIEIVRNIDHRRDSRRRPSRVEPQPAKVCEAPDATIERPKQFQWIHDLPPQHPTSRDLKPARRATVRRRASPW